MTLSGRIKRRIRLSIARRWGSGGLAAYDAFVYALSHLRRSLVPDSGDANRKTLRRLIRRGDVCLDIGANVGAYTGVLSPLLR